MDRAGGGGPTEVRKTAVRGRGKDKGRGTPKQFVKVQPPIGRGGGGGGGGGSLGGGGGSLGGGGAGGYEESFLTHRGENLPRSVIEAEEDDGDEEEGGEGMAVIPPREAKDILYEKSILLPITMRVISMNANINAAAPIAETLLAPLKEMLVRLLGQETVMCLQRNHGSLREVFERSSPTTQCKNVITGQMENCWICGGDIISGHEYLGFECEHVFPIAQALAFTGLYEHSLFEALSGSVADEYKTGLELEYKPSHRYCNQIKNDTHFISINAGGIHIDPELIDMFLTTLSNSRTFGGWEVLGMKKEDIFGRRQAIIDVCSPIIDLVHDVSPNPEVHAKQTALYLQEYVAIDPNCGTKEIVPDTKPVSPQSGTLSLLEKHTDISACQYAVNKACNYFFGTLNPLIDVSIKREYPARVRAIIKNRLYDMQIVFKDEILKMVPPIIDRLRDNLIITLQRAGPLQQHRPDRSLQGIWSSYQVVISQLIPMAVLDVVRQYFDVPLRTELKRKFEGEPGFQRALDGIVTGFLPFIQTFLNTNARKVYPVVFHTHDDHLINIGEVNALMAQLTGEIQSQNSADYPNFYQLSNGTVGTIVPPPRQGGGHRTRRRKRVRRRNTRHR